jgi:hypothetical protein
MIKVVGHNEVIRDGVALPDRPENISSGLNSELSHRLPLLAGFNMDIPG